MLSYCHTGTIYTIASKYVIIGVLWLLILCQQKTTSDYDCAADARLARVCGDREKCNRASGAAVSAWVGWHGVGVKSCPCEDGVEADHCHQCPRRLTISSCGSVLRDDPNPSSHNPSVSVEGKSPNLLHLAWSHYSQRHITPALDRYMVISQ